MAKKQSKKRATTRSRRAGKSTTKRDLGVLSILVLVVWFLLAYPSEILSFVESGDTVLGRAVTDTELVSSPKVERDPIMGDKPIVLDKKSDLAKANESKAEVVTDKSSEEVAVSSSPKHITGALELPAIKDSTYLYHNSDGRYHVLYDKENKIPKYVAYVLTHKEVSQNLVKRHNKFDSDSYFNSKGVFQADNNDYLRSGYDRGHMLPSADRNDSESENIATFLYTNITPQIPALNRRTLSQLEKMVRAWSLKYDSLFVVTGSLLSDNSSRPIKRIGKGVAVPQYIYKVVAAKDGHDYKTIGFMMPNIESISNNYRDYIESVDNIEMMTGVDFFHHLPDSIEDACESSVDLKFWK